MDHWVNLFRSHFQKKENSVYVQEVPFLVNLERFCKNSYPSQSYVHFSNELESKPPYVYVGGGAKPSINAVNIVNQGWKLGWISPKFPLYFNLHVHA